MVFPKKKFILVEINHFPGESVLLKIKENGPVNCFSQDFWFLCFRSPPKTDYFFAVPPRGSFGRILTMQLEPPKTQFTRSEMVGGQVLGAHFATRGLEPVPVDASTGSTKNRKKPGNTTRYLKQTERRTKVRLGQADAGADTLDEQAAATLKATRKLVLASCCVLWIDN